MQLTKEQLSFLARFSRTPDGAQLVQILRARLAARDKAARVARGEDVQRTLGAACELDEFIADIEGAEAQLNRNATAHQRHVVFRPE